ncbi:hypothetical protein N9N67_03715 [Bacteriovoracaceae bacterium]|nr:hypothetical protein [Bacteriovoracaceae bacterium]
MAGLFDTLLIHTGSRFEIFKTLEEMNLEKRPYFIELEVFKSEEEKILKYIEQFLVGISSNVFPYSVYVQSNLNYYSKYFTVVKSFHSCPAFYRKKSKLLSVKEQKIQDRIELKLRKLINLGIGDRKQHIEAYAKFHKKLYTLCDEGIKLENVLKLLEKAG